MSARILIVDDTAVNRKVLGAILRKESWEILEAADGGEALERAREVHPDLILLDIMMPVKDGYEVCEELKHDPATADIPIIFLSALGEASDKIRGLELGAVDFLTKPVNRAEVVARVRAHLRLGELTRFLLDLNEQLQEKTSRHEHDLQAASEIQRAILPSEEFKAPGVEFTWRFDPCESIGGDIFNMVRLTEDLVGFFVLDVAGHGIPSALVAVSVAQLFSTNSELLIERDLSTGNVRVRTPAEVLQKLDAEYPMDRLDRHFTVFFGILDTRTGKLSYSSAAHPPAMLIRSDGKFELLEEGGPLIGMGAFLPYEEAEVQLEPGDRIFMYTDGIPEHPDDAGDMFGLERFQEGLLESRGQSLSGACDSLLTDLMLHGGGVAPPDDITLMALEFRPVAVEPRPETVEEAAP